MFNKGKFQDRLEFILKSRQKNTLSEQTLNAVESISSKENVTEIDVLLVDDVYNILKNRENLNV